MDKNVATVVAADERVIYPIIDLATGRAVVLAPGEQAALEFDAALRAFVRVPVPSWHMPLPPKA